MLGVSWDILASPHAAVEGAPLLVRIQVTPFMPQPMGTVPLKLLLPRSRNHRCGIVPLTAQLRQSIHASEPQALNPTHANEPQDFGSGMSNPLQANLPVWWRTWRSYPDGKVPDKWLLKSCSLMMFGNDPLVPHVLGIEPAGPPARIELIRYENR